MKRKFLYLIIAAGLTLTSCDKFLERPQIGTIPETEAITDEASLMKLLNGGYNNVAYDMYSGRVNFLNDLLGDQANGTLYSEDFGEIFRRKTSIFGGYKNDTYRNFYKIINNANKVLDNIDKASANKALIEAQAKFLRAAVHFETVKLWAQPWGFTTDNSHSGVPLRLTSTADIGTRATVKEVYDAIIADLQSAENSLPDAVTANYPSKWAAKALLARVFFQQNNFAQAFNYADQVIKSNKFTLDADHTKRFALGTGTSTGSKEAIFYFKDNATDFAPGGEIRDRYRSDAGNFQSQSDFHVTDLYYSQATSTNDVRKAWYTKNSAGFNVLNKFNANRFDVPVIHLTEIVLIRAEAGAELGGANLVTAIADINSILTRAYGGTSMNVAVGAPAGTVIAAARTQRELELIGEGSRTQEIKRIGARTNTNIDRRTSPWNCPGFILQFPQGENAANTSFQMNPEGGCL
jgi:tetratricopeptide (TPR) repeat protein